MEGNNRDTAWYNFRKNLMTNSFLKITSGIFVLLLIVAALPMIADITEKENVPAISASSVNLSSYTENSVDRIAFKQKDAEEVVLERSGEEWKVGSDIADAEKVMTIFQAFSKLEIREMVSKNEGNFGKFGVSKDDGIRLAIRERNGKEHIFYVGKVGMIPQEFSFRKDGIKNTYSVRGVLRELLLNDAAHWKKAESAGSDSEAGKEVKK